MAPAPPILLNEIAKLTLPDRTINTTRTFVFAATDTTPSFIVVYENQAGKAVPTITAIVTAFTKSRRPRREPHEITLQDGTVIQAIIAGCACGNPVKRISWTTAYKDFSLIPTP